ncbi:MAG: alpha/beta hydrolase [Hyphomonadaceae bacterium]|nr:alpha/beta hydrolase [Hyphomonadaceae bacterium]
MDVGTLDIGGFEERVFQSVDGLALYARDYPPLAPETGLPVICLHGLTRNSKDFEVIAPRIAACGRRVIAADVRGRGQSAHDPDPAHYVPTVYAQDVAALMDALAVPKAVFVGTSMGGLITMVLAALAPDRVAAVVLNDIGHKLDPAGLARIGGYVGRTQPVQSWEQAADAIRAIACDIYPTKRDDPSFWLSFAQRTFRTRDDGSLSTDYDPHIALAMASPGAPPPDMTPLFQALANKPTLLLRGGISDLLSPGIVAEMRALKPDLVAVDVAHVGHAPMLDEPEAWDAILSFLARID